LSNKPAAGNNLLIIPQPSEQIRKISEHFISFIQKLDSFFEEETKREDSIIV
jgi:hypothetical protein